MGKYVNLHQHSEESTLDGYAKITDIVTHAKEIGHAAAAITDHGECSGHIQMYEAGIEHDLPVVLGMEGYWVPDLDAYREATKPAAPKRYPNSIIGQRATNSHICLLARDQQGLSNLWAWSSMAYEDHYRHVKPLADPALMRQYAEGLYGSDGCMLTEFGHAVEEGDEGRCREIFAFMLDVFGDRFYSELHTWRIINPVTDDEKRMNAVMTEINRAKVRLATEMGVPLVVVNDAHYTQEDDWRYHRLVWQFNTFNNDQTESVKHAADWLMSEDEIRHHMGFHGISAQVVNQAIDNSYDIAMSCQGVKIEPTMDMPRLGASDAEDVTMFLDSVEEGYKRKIVATGLDEEVYWPRVEQEIRLIIDKGFAGYFRITQDMVRSFRDGSYIQWVNGDVAKTPRLCGPGRGSAGGSLVTFLLDITALDPIKYGLLFERFLTEDRTDWPDIDTDVPQSGRPDAKAYIRARYDHTCAIGTRSRSGAAQTLRDLREPLDIPWGDMTEIGKLLKNLRELIDTTGDEELDDAAVASMTWGEIVAFKGGDLMPYQKRHPELFDYMERMVGLVRQTSVHAAAQLMGNQSFLGRMPTRIKNDTRTTQFDMYEVEKLGGCKMDILGIRHLDTLEQCRELVYERHGLWLDYDGTGYGTPPGADNIIVFGDDQYRDPVIWEQIATGETLGIFQLETPSATKAAIDFKPTSEIEVCDLISVNRPGVIHAGQLPHYMARREGSEKPVYDHPLMEAVTGPGWLSDTYGILVYQEQLMRAAEVLADFTPTERERLRKIIGKKKVDAMVALEVEFKARCLANPDFVAPFNSSRNTAERAQAVVDKIWRSLIASASYAFNRCVAGNTVVKLGGSGSHSDGTMTVGDMWARLHNLAAPGAYRVGDPCRFCGHPSVANSRQQCSACYAWRKKFTSNHRLHGVRSWSLGDDGRLHPNRIVDVHFNGRAAVWRVKLADGCGVMATANHRHMTPGGWVEVGDLRVGDELLVCGDYERQFYESTKDRTTEGEPSYAGARLPNDQRNGENSLGYRTGGFLSLREWTEATDKVCAFPGCGRSAESGHRIERAHLDGNRRNNDPSNLAMLCVSHHKAHDYQVNGRRRRGGKGYPVVPVRITEIDYVGEREVFDLEMADPHHSWVGNGVVTHNSHGMGYGLVASWETWDKCYFFSEFITASLRTDKRAGWGNKYIRTARRRGLKILPPDINASEGKFSLAGSDIRYGLLAIAQVGEAAATDIVAKAPYVDFSDFLARTKCNKQVVINLITIGAFDAFSSRDNLLKGYERWRIMDARKGKTIVVDGHRIPKDRLTETQVDEIVADALATPTRNRAQEIIGPSKWIIEIPDFSDERVIIALEEELVGNYVTIDPMYKFIDMIETHCVQRVIDIKEMRKGTTVAIGGQITKVKEHVIAKGEQKGQKMAFVAVTWGDEEFDITVFADTWATSKSYLHVGSPVVLNCIRDNRGVHLSTTIRLDWAVKQKESA